MLCRNTEKAEKTACEIQKDTGNQVDVHKLDLSSLKSVRECAQVLLDKEEKIDILINNAGRINHNSYFNLRFILNVFSNKGFLKLPFSTY